MSLLADLLEDRQRAEEVSLEAIPPLLCQLSALQSTLAARLARPPSNGQGEPPGEDQLLTVEEAARKLGVSKDWLYRHSRKLPFSVRLGHRQLRFTARGIERYIRQRQGR